MNPQKMSLSQWRGFHCSTQKHTENSPRLGLQGLEALFLLGCETPPRTLQDGSPDNQRVPLGYLNAVVLKANNGGAESINSQIVMIRVHCRGFQNKKRFRNAIYFHHCGFDLYPARIKQQGSPLIGGRH